MRCACRAELAEDDAIREARRLMDEVCYHGNLHIFVFDGNLSDDWFGPGPDGARQSVLDNDAKMSPEDVAEEMRLVELLEPMTYEQRASAYGSCLACLDSDPAPSQAVPITPDTPKPPFHELDPGTWGRVLREIRRRNPGQEI
jgi:hypothetical protein